MGDHQHQLTVEELSTMSLEDVEALAASLPRWPRRSFWDWLWERGRPWGTDESFGEFWRFLGKRMRETGADRVAELGEEVTEEWHPRLMTEYGFREKRVADGMPL